jgi:hypothetical protein
LHIRVPSGGGGGGVVVAAAEGGGRDGESKENVGTLAVKFRLAEFNPFPSSLTN